MTPAAAAQMHDDVSACIARFDAGMLAVLTRYPEPIPVGEAQDSDYAALIEAVRDDPLRAHFEDDEQ
jgi:hypothetical protein